MTPDLQKEFALLSAKAKQHLKDVPESGTYKTLFSFWVWPSFSRSFRCTVYSPERAGKKPFADFTIWRSDLDLEKFRSPVERLRHPKELAPTIENSVLGLNEQEILEIEKRILGISIPIFQARPASFGLDGTRFEFQYDLFQSGLSLYWWEDHPEDWRPFTSVITSIVKNLENRLKENAR